MLKTGERAPYFEGVDQGGDMISLKDFKGRRLILYFYPKDLTPGCTIQAMNLTNHLEELETLGYSVIGVSADSVKRHCSFTDKIGIGFKLLADESKTIINAYGVWGPKKFMGKSFEGIKRVTFLIDENGLIEHIIEKVKTKSHAQQIIDLVKEKIE